jgi:hypothetical protein
MKSPRFSVVIPTYNREGLLKETIESVLAQTYSDYELIVADNGSTDGTLPMLLSYGSKLRILSESRRGGEFARSKGASGAKGEYIALLDDDDLFFPNTLEVYNRIITAESAPAVIFGSMEHFSNDNRPPTNMPNSSEIAYRSYADFLSKDIPFVKSNSRIVIKRVVAESSKGLRAEPPASLTDDVNLLLLSGTAGPAIIVERPHTVCYRVHQTNSSSNVVETVDSILALVRRERQGDFPGGKERRFERYAFLGGCSLPYVRRALKQHRIRLALRLAFKTHSMITAAIINKLSRYFKPATALTLLRNDSETIS